MTRKRDVVKTQFKKEIPLPKRIGIDILGGLLILGSILFGWLPGPGGIPLFLAGLGLLSINHAWARRILLQIKANGSKLSTLIFREDHPTLALAYDIIAIFMIVGGSIAFGISNHNIVRGLMIALILLGVSLFLGNRKRHQKLNAFVRRTIRRNQQT